MADNELDPKARGLIEQNIDDLVGNPSSILHGLMNADIAMNEETLMAFTHGYVTSMCQSIYRNELESDLSTGALQEVENIVSRRRPEIIGAYREELDVF